MIETLKLLEKLSQEHDSALVAFSGGKDSLVVMDLAVKTFKHVEGFFMYFVPGLEACERPLREAQQRWGVKIHQTPHWVLSRCIRDGVYCLPRMIDQNLPLIQLQDVYQIVRHKSKIDLILTGAKASDSLWRRRNLKATAVNRDVYHPLESWAKLDVLAYLQRANIPLPDSSGKQATGVDLTVPSVTWLYDHHHDDYLKLINVFPLAEAIIQRRLMFGDYYS